VDGLWQGPESDEDPTFPAICLLREKLTIIALAIAVVRVTLHLCLNIFVVPSDPHAVAQHGVAPRGSFPGAAYGTAQGHFLGQLRVTKSPNSRWFADGHTFLAMVQERTAPIPELLP
jgi:hypothetical protein